MGDLNLTPEQEAEAQRLAEIIAQKTKEEVLPKPKARRKCTPAPSNVGLDFTSRLTGRIDILASILMFCVQYILSLPTVLKATRDLHQAY